jgi:hypothetical protein
MEINQRIGKFLILLGVVLLILFNISELPLAEKEPLLVWGFFTTGVGLVTVYRNKPDGPGESERFKGIKNLLFNRPEKKKKK